jgi:hypothetical protein
MTRQTSSVRKSRSPAAALAAAAPRPDPVAAARPDSVAVPKSEPVAVPRSVALSGSVCLTAWGRTDLRFTAQFPESASAIVTRVWRHDSPVRALCFQLCDHSGNVRAERLILFALFLFVLGHCETCKAHGTQYRNGKEYLDHAATSIAERLA